MNGSFRHAWFFLGSVALLTLSAGCAQKQKTAQVPGRSETFESRAPEAARDEYGRARGPDYAAEGHPRGDVHHMTRKQQEQERQRQQQAGATQGVAPQAMTELQLCNQLTGGSTLTAQDIDNGVRIVLRPKTGQDVAAIRETAQRIEQRMLPMAAPAPRGDAASQCALFDVGQLGARASIQERPDEVHLILTTTDTANLSSLRQRARDFVEQSGRAQQGGAGSGQQQP